ncbi:hypothetical protein EJB05_09614 [Eragrostis curvula]|uniref:ACT domain-containing protein n=1 Tax=Eragrostis curvula TaxID=38414 RepID=A0A5J9W488_9POAL|nr:hypothetical protein EJB05_09614 [Eragrostis curvula]
MSPRYVVDVDADDKAEDVLLHLRILDECADPDKRPFFLARHIEGRPLHEIIFCSLDKPKLLSQLSELLDEVGLHIRELHLYCTNDGFCLAIIFVDGWETEVKFNAYMHISSMRLSARLFTTS